MHFAHCCYLLKYPFIVFFCIFLKQQLVVANTTLSSGYYTVHHSFHVVVVGVIVSKASNKMKDFDWIVSILVIVVINDHLKSSHVCLCISFACQVVWLFHHHHH